VDFATIGSNRSATFEQARRAYYDAIQKEHPDRGGSEEQAKCINAAWDRIKRFYGRR
jgi:curved DNA-binding protein CbpA